MAEKIKIKDNEENTKESSAGVIYDSSNNYCEERIFELEKQLHEQYAINNNSNAGTLVSLIGSLLVVMTAYGSMLYQYNLSPSIGITMLYLAAIIVLMVVALLYCICIHIGSGQRMEQFITYAIRMKHYGLTQNYAAIEDNEYNQRIKRYKDIYPKDYHPFKKNMNNFVQGIYNLLSNAFIVTLYIIVVTLAIVAYEEKGYILLFFCGTMLLHILLYGYKYFKYTKYKEREKEMKIVDYKKQTESEHHSYKYELHIKPNSLVITVIVILLLCIVSVTAFPYFELFFGKK